MKSLTPLISLAAAALLAAGCASSGYKKGNKAAESIQSASAGIAALPGHIDQSLSTLNALVANSQADLRPQFKALQSNISKLESAARQVADQRRRVGEETRAFLESWNAELGQIQNPDIKGRSQARKDEVAQQIEAVKRSYSEFDVAFKPFLTDLKDVEKYLSVDLTRAGVASVREPVAKAANDAGPLKASIEKLAADFKTLGTSMSSVVTQQSQ
jgi:hypothetical protein